MSASRMEQSVAMPRRRIARRARLLLLLPFAAVLLIPLYDRIDPGFFTVPFVHWYQLAWAVISAALLYFIYRLENEPGYTSPP